MSRGPKIAFIGAGSARWTSRILIDIFMNRDLQNSEIWLMDIDDRRLDIIYTFARRYIEEIKSPIKVYATKDRRKAIDNADFVISTVLAKGYTYYETMRDISEKYGYYRGINSVEWNMVADYHTIWGYYQFKVHLEIARDIEELAPNAWFFIVSNPVLELTTMIGRKTKVKVAGICHGFLGFRAALEVLAMRLADERNEKDLVPYCAAHMSECYEYLVKTIDLSDVEIEMKGLNHDIWLTKFRYRGEDAYKYVDEWIKNNAEEYWAIWREHTWNPFDIDLSPAAIDMYKTYGLLPIGDTVRGGTWKYHWDLKTKQYWYGPYGGPDSEIGCAIRILHVRMSIEEMTKTVYDYSTPITQRIPMKPSGEVIVSLIDYIYNNKSSNTYTIPYPKIGYIHIPIYVNIMNNGTIPEIPSDVAVEVPVHVDGKGIHPRSLGSLPSNVYKYAILPRLIRMEWAIEANIKGGRDALFEWLITDMRTKSTRQAEEVINAILSMPENEEMAKHFS